MTPNQILAGLFLVLAIYFWYLRNQEGFLVKLPYSNLETNNYSLLYHNKTTPTKIKRSPGYFQHYPDYFENIAKLKDPRLGYSITGQPYKDYKFDDNKLAFDMKSEPFLYPQWHTMYRKDADYIGYPWYFR